MLLAHEYKRYVSRHAQGALAGRLKEVTRPWKSMLTLRELDEHITVPLGGFRDLEHYMTESSCSEYLDGVSVPLLGINALVCMYYGFLHDLRGLTLSFRYAIWPWYTLPAG